jgi:6-phosphogluconolactonase
MNRKIFLSVSAGGMLSQALPSFSAPADRSVRVYFGTFTKGDDGGIFQSELNLDTGQLSQPSLAGHAVRPGFLAVHPDGKHVYAVGELAGFSGKNADSVCAFEINPATGELEALNAQPGGGGEPCHLTIDPSGRYVLSAQYGGGSCAVFPIADDGSLKPKSSFHQHVGASGVNPKRQEAPHAHSINVDPSGQIAVVADLGKDQVVIYQFDAQSGVLTPNNPATLDTPPGSGPRHFVFHPTKPFAYVNMEMSSQVSALSFDAVTGRFDTLQTLSTLPADFDGLKAVAEIRITPDGRFVYVSNRGHDHIAIFSVNPMTGKLSLVGHESTRGKFPRNFNIDPTGQFLVVANQQTNNVVVFRIDPMSGKLTFTGSEIKVPKPVCVSFMPMR